MPITGTPYSLDYLSSDAAGQNYLYSLNIPLIGATVPASLQQITLSVQVAGQLFSETFSPTPNLSTTYTWDGKDVYGRTVQGLQKAIIIVGYVYPGVYQGRALPTDLPRFPTASQSSPLDRRLASTARSRSLRF